MVSTCWPPTPSSKIEVESNGYVSLFMFLMQELESAWSGGLLSSEGESFTSNQIIFRRNFPFMSNACECGQVHRFSTIDIISYGQEELKKNYIRIILLLKCSCKHIEVTILFQYNNMLGQH